MKCFIASAFGKDDVNRVYTKLVKPVLRDLRVNGRRVDQIEHNEEIDNVIFAELDSSQLCIADLTYARPSAYFEAGYAAGQGKPVIYICRSDHFRNLDDALRVHFDLQMKNIIPWPNRPSHSADANFSRKLRKRLQLVLRPLNKNREVERSAGLEKQRKELQQKRFARLSVEAQYEEINAQAVTTLRSFGFGLEHKDGEELKQSGILVQRSCFFGVLVEQVSKLTSGQLQFALTKSVHLFAKQSKVRRVETVLVIASVRPLSMERIKRSVRGGEVSGKSDNLLRYELPVWSSTNGKRSPPHTVTIGLIGSVKSTEQFDERLKEVLDEVIHPPTERGHRPLSLHR